MPALTNTGKLRRAAIFVADLLAVCKNSGSALETTGSAPARCSRRRAAFVGGRLYPCRHAEGPVLPHRQYGMPAELTRDPGMVPSSPFFAVSARGKRTATFKTVIAARPAFRVRPRPFVAYFGRGMNAGRRGIRVFIHVLVFNDFPTSTRIEQPMRPSFVMPRVRLFKIFSVSRISEIVRCGGHQRNFNYSEDAPAEDQRITVYFS